MKALNFLPLLIWSMLMLPVFEITHRKVYRAPMPKSASEASAIMYIIGCVAWLLICAACAYGE